MPLSPTEMYPAQAPHVAVRTLTLRTGIQMRIAERGPLNGPTVILLHGWGALLYMYRHALERLPAAGFRTIAVDLRGYGLSDKPTADGTYSLMVYQADIDALLDELGADRVALVGQSMGGGLALRYALTRPHRVSKLALINPTGLSAVPYLKLLQSVPTRLLDAIGTTLVPRWAIGWILRHIAYTDGSLVTERDIDEYWAPTQRAGYVHAARAALSEFDWRIITDEEAQSLAVSTLVILGERDRLLHTSNAEAAKLRASRVERVPGGHCPHEEHPDHVYAMLADFIR
jgi:pimeloyl-ACP methyl ester carboxylesterase